MIGAFTINPDLYDEVRLNIKHNIRYRSKESVGSNVIEDSGAVFLLLKY